MKNRWFVYAAAAIALTLSACAGDVGQDDDAEELDDPSSEEADFDGDSDSLRGGGTDQLRIKDFDDVRDVIREIPGPADGDPGPLQHPQPARQTRDFLYRGHVPVAVNPAPV